MTLPLILLAIWGHIWKLTVEKSQINATNVTLHLLRQAIWGDIWKHTVEKSQINATNVTLHPHRQAIWSDIWKYIVEKSQASATNLDRVPAWLEKKQVGWGTWQYDYVPSHAGNLRIHLKTHSEEKSNKCNQYNFASSQAGDFMKIKNTLWRKVK